MGIATFVRAELTKRYSAAFSFKNPNDCTVCVYDLMQDLKAIPETITTMESLITYIVGKIKFILLKTGSVVRTIIVMVDRAPPPVKRMVEHKKRYKGKNVLSPEEGPYLPRDPSGLIPSPWINFAGNYKLLQRELYPRLFNAFMEKAQYITRPGQRIILHGFPGRSEYVTVYKQRAYEFDSNSKGQVKQVLNWEIVDSVFPITERDEQADPDLYNRIYIVENVVPCAEWPQGAIIKQEWEEARNEIAEADGAMFFYDHFFQTENIMFVCNDGDVFAYGLLYASERVVAQNTFRNRHYVCLPYKKKKHNEFFAEGKIPTREYVDFNAMYCLVCEDDSLNNACVQNNIASLTFLIILGGTDFFKDYMKGLGAENIIWDTYFTCLDLFAYMIQMSKGVTAETRPLQPRAVIIDEDLFRLFVHYCYLQKHGKTIRKKMKIKEGTDITYAQLKAFCGTGKRAQNDPEYKLPERNTIRLWCRQIEWNILYFKNTPFGNRYSPNPFEELGGLPYFPYIVNAQTQLPEMTDVVSARQKHIDEVYLQHMYKRVRAKRGGGGERETRNTPSREVKEQKKRKIIEVFNEMEEEDI